MKFKDFKYERPDFEITSKQFSDYLDQLEKATDKETFLKVFTELNKLRLHISTMNTLVSIRHSINTADKFYDDENNYWDEMGPMYGSLENRLSKIAVKVPFKDELLDSIPEPFFKLAECQLKTFDEKIIPDLQEENKLVSEYNKLKASAIISFEGKEYNLTQIQAICESKDRDLRKRAYDAKMAFYQEHEKQFDDIYDALVKKRDTIAKKLGYKNFVELGYNRMSRLDYNEKMVSNYRQQIIDEITPIDTELCQKQAKRLNLDKLAYYDYGFEFTSGNATPKKDPDGLVKAAQQMYHEMSKETGSFIDTMINDDLWDLLAKPNKETGGYCTSIPEYKVPFIFSNFNGTSGDVDVLTHEAGHAFMCYMASDIQVPECLWPTMEACEIHSMSMEFFAHPWTKLFFEEDDDKYHFSHVASTLKFLPYGALVDHFQHEVYNHPEYTPEKRKQVWRELELQYTPFKNYDGCEMLEKGCWWYQQSHIFQVPFYYIDYTLAQVCALQFFVRMLNKDEKAWPDYLHLCKLGGTKTFTQLVKEANLKSPFEDGCLSSVASTVHNYLNNIDDSKF